MKVYFLFAAVLLSCTDLSGIRAQDPREVEIRTLELGEAVAILKLDMKSLENYWGKSFVVNSPRHTINERKNVVDLFSQGNITYSSFKREIERITFICDIAVCMGHEVVSPTGKTPHAGKKVTRRYTNVWIKNDTGWQLEARQATNILIE